MRFIIFEDHKRDFFLPFSYTRPVFHLRAGIFTFIERWEQVLGLPVLSRSYDYLDQHYGQKYFIADSDPIPIWINGRFIPTENLIEAIEQLAPGEAIKNNQNDIIAARFLPKQLIPSYKGLITYDHALEMGLNIIEPAESFEALEQVHDLFLKNNFLISFDIEIIRKKRVSQKIDDKHSAVYYEDNIFVEEGVKVRAAILNAENGPIYLGKGVSVGAGSIILGNHAICHNAKLSIGTKLRGDSTVGPFCKVGGEVTNSVVMGYSNKAHDGYLGNSVLGYWCNLGAGTNTSNLKNNYGTIKRWDYPSESSGDSGLQFYGLTMGDHSKCGISTMFNSGAVVGVCANVFGGGFARNFIPSFSWGGVEGLSTYRFSKAIEVIEKVKKRRSKTLEATEKSILKETFERTSKYRTWDKQEVGNWT